MEFIGTLLLLLLVSVVWAVIKAAGRATWKKVTEPKDSLKKAERDAVDAAYANSLSRTATEEYVDSQRLGVAFSRYAMLVAMADGQLAPEEYRAIFAFFSGAHPTYLSFIHESIQRDATRAGSIDWDYNAATMKELLNKPHFAGIDAIMFDALLQISAADGNIAPAELSVISGIMASLGWTSEKIQSYFRSRFGTVGDDVQNQAGEHLSAAYHMLGLTRGASEEEVKRKYRELAKSHHPDVYAQMGNAMQQAATKRFQEIQDAYRTILEANHA